MTAVDHQNRGHARLGGSAASIFTVCTAAPALWAGRERRATAFTREGTAAHELAEATLRGDTSPMPTSMEVEGETVQVTDELALAVRDYVALVADLRASADWHAIEQGFTLDALWHPGQAPEPMFGSADFVAVVGDLLIVLDLKMGKGVMVSAEGNAQLLYYALGAFFALQEQHPELAVEISHVRVGICQPRMKDEPDWWDIPLIDLILWGERVLKRAVDEIQAGNTVLKAGKHCQFCQAKGACPELHRQAMAVAKGKFPPPAPTLLSDQELGEALQQAEVLSTWLNGVRAEVESRISTGHPVPGWKLVAKKGYRQWTDPEAVIGLLGIATGDRRGFMSDPQLLSPAQVEKKLKVLGYDPKLVDPLIVAPVTGTTLVPETDKRPAVMTGPQDVFTTVE